MKLLVVEDERRLANSIADLLRTHGFEVDVAYDGPTGYDYAASGVYDLMILDVMLPGENGFDVARRLRSERNGTPILMLTARSETADRIAGLDAGADYYLTKPFDTGELLACVRALLRRQREQVEVLSFGDTALDLSTCTLSCGADSVRLSNREFDIMRILMGAQHRNVPKESILTKVWGYDSNADENHVEVYVSFLRKKLSSIGSHVRIVAIRRQGYHLEAEEV